MDNLAPQFEDFLHSVKKLLGDNGLMVAGVDFFGVTEQAAVQGIGENIRYLIFFQRPAAVAVPPPALSGFNASLKQEHGDVLKAGVVLGVKLKGFFDDRGFYPVHDDGLSP